MGLDCRLLKCSARWVPVMERASYAEQWLALEGPRPLASSEPRSWCQGPSLVVRAIQRGVLGAAATEPARGLRSRDYIPSGTSAWRRRDTDRACAGASFSRRVVVVGVAAGLAVTR